MATNYSDDVTRIFEKTVAISADTTLTAADSGKTYLLDAIGEAITLPAPYDGCKFKFLITAAIATSSWVITATDALISGSVTEAGLVQLAAAETAITIVHTKSIAGDWIELVSDGTSWFLSGQLSVASSLTTA